MMWQKKARFLYPKSLPTRSMILLGVLLPCFLASCSNPPLSSADPPHLGKVLYALYVLWDKPIHSGKDVWTTPFSLTAEAMRSGDGQKIWQASVMTGSVATSFQSATIISAGSVLFVTVSTPQTGGQNAQVIALDARSGQVLWKAMVDGTSISHAVITHGTLYMEVDERVEALDGSSGKRLWSASPDAGYKAGELVVTSNTIYVEQEASVRSASQGNYDSAILYALRLSDGKELWRREVANTITDHLSSLIHVNIEADERTVYVFREGQMMEFHGNVSGFDTRSTLFALNAQDGSSLWSKQIQQSEEGSRQFELALFNQVLYLVGIANPGINTLSAFQSQDGKQLWTWQTPLLLNPFAPPNHIYGSSLHPGENFCALHANNGSKAWCAGYNQVGPALFSEGKIYLYALKVTSQGSSSSEQPAQIEVLNESDGSLAAHYWTADVTRMRLESIALS